MTDIEPHLPVERVSQSSRGTFCAALASLLVAATGRSARAAAPIVIDGKGDWLFPGWESLADAGTTGIASTVQTIAATQRAFNAGGISLLVLVVPIKARMYPDKLPDGVTIAPAVQARYGAILEALGNAKIATFDVVSVLKSIPEPMFFRTDDHWTEWSAEAVARACAAQLKTLANLPPNPQKLPPLSAFSTDPHVGDLADLLPAEKKAAVGGEPIAIRVIDGSRVTLLDAASAHVHVVGNSFSMPYLGFPEMLAETLQEPVGVTAKFGNAGPWKTMLEYLESPNFAAKRPRVVVWQFVEGLFMHGPAASGIWDIASLMADQTFLARVTKAVPAGAPAP